MYQCGKCKKQIEPNETYEYRGAFSCSEHFDEVIKDRDYQRSEIMAEENAKTAKFAGLDLSGDTVIGKANRDILRADIEIASKESARLKDYEGRNE